MKVFIKILELDLIVIFAFFLLEGSLFARDPIFIDAKINGQPVRMAFDSGAEATVLYRQSASRLKLKIIESDPGEKPELGMTLMAQTEPADFTLLGNSGKTIFRVLDLPTAADAEGEDGIVSWFILKNNLLRIDANEHKLSFLNELPSNIEEWTKVPIKMDSKTLILEMPKSGGKNGGILVDAGSFNEVALSSVNWQKWKRDNPDLKSTLTGYYMPGAGLIITEVMWAKVLKLGPLKLANVLVREANIAESSNTGDLEFEMSLSMAGLRALNFIVDGRNGFAYFSPLSHEGTEVTYNRAGALFAPQDLNTNDLIAHVKDHSPASEAGVKNGDILLAINSEDVTHWREKDGPRFSVLAQQPAGTKIALTLKRGDKRFETVITLKDILGPSVESKP